MPHERQLLLQFDLTTTRPTRRDLLEKLQIPEFVRSSGGKARMNTRGHMKSLLLMIQSRHGKLGPPHLTIGMIAFQMGYCERTIIRAVKDCEQLDLLKVQRSCSKTSFSVYEIQWINVYQMILDDPRTESLINLEHLYDRSKSEPSPDKSPPSPDNFIESPDRSNASPDNFSASPDNSAFYRSSSTSLTRARAEPSKPLVNQYGNPCKPSANKSEKSDGSLVGFSLWKDAKPEEFKDPKKIQEVFELHRRAGLSTGDQRLALFRCVISIVRDPRADNVPGLITDVLRGDKSTTKYGPWHGRGTIEDEESARAMIRQLDVPPEMQKRTSDLHTTQSPISAEFPSDSLSAIRQSSFDQVISLEIDQRFETVKTNLKTLGLIEDTVDSIVIKLNICSDEELKSRLRQYRGFKLVHLEKASYETKKRFCEEFEPAILSKLQAMVSGP